MPVFPHPQPNSSSDNLSDLVLHEPPLNSPFFVKIKRTDNANTAIRTNTIVNISNLRMGMLNSFVLEIKHDF